MKEKNINKIINLIPIGIILAVVPWIVRLKMISTPIGSLEYLAYPLRETNHDFFSYYKSILIIFFSYSGLLIFLFKNQVIKTKYNYLLLGMGILITISTILSPFMSVALKGVGDRYEGAFVWIGYLIVTLLGMNLSKDKVAIKRLLGLAFIGVGVVGIVGVFQFFGLDLFKSEIGKYMVLPRELWGNISELNIKFGKYIIYSTYFNPNYGGSLMVMFLFVAIMVFLGVKKTSYKIMSYLFYILIFINWIGCRSRAGFLAGQITLILFVIFYRKKLLINYKKIVTLVITGIVIGLIMNSFSQESLGKKLYDIESSKYNHMREIKVISPTHIEIKTDIARLNIILEDKKLIFKDSNKNLLNPKFEEDSYKFTEENYKLYNIKKEGLNHYNINYGSFRYPLITQNNKLQTVGFKGKISDIFMAERVKWLDGYETKGSSRIYIWSRSIPKLKVTGFFGGGADTYSIVFPQYDNFGKAIGFRNPRMIVDKPHNLYLQIMMNMGYLFFVVFIVFIGSYIIDSILIYKNKKFDDFYEIVGLGVALAISGYLIAGMFNDSAVSVAPYFWFFMGLGISINMKLKARKLL